MIQATNTPEHQLAIMHLVVELVERAEREFPRLKEQHCLDGLGVSFDLTGTAAGRAQLQAHNIQFNDWLVKHNLQAFLDETVAHELAHIIHHKLFPGDRAWHGKRWQEIMRRLGYEPQRCHDLDLTGMPGLRRQRRWVYKCDCRTHELTTVRHNKVRRIGRSYTCKLCGTILTFTGEQA